MHSLCCVFPRSLFQTMRFRCSFFCRVCFNHHFRIVFSWMDFCCCWIAIASVSSMSLAPLLYYSFMLSLWCECELKIFDASHRTVKQTERQRDRETERARQMIRDEKHSVRWKQVVQWSNHHYMYYSMLSLSLRIVPTHIFPSASVHCFSCKVHEWKVARTNEHLWRIRIRQNMRRGCQQRRRTTTLPRPNNKFDDFQRI